MSIYSMVDVGNRLIVIYAFLICPGLGDCSNKSRITHRIAPKMLIIQKRPSGWTVFQFHLFFRQCGVKGFHHSSAGCPLRTPFHVVKPNELTPWWWSYIVCERALANCLARKLAANYEIAKLSKIWSVCDAVRWKMRWLS